MFNSLKAFNSLYEIHRACLLMYPNGIAFNSLYEIRDAPNPAQEWQVCCFQFSLWDSLHPPSYRVTANLSLSILFMRFYVGDAFRPGDTFAAFNSLYEIRMGLDEGIFTWSKWLSILFMRFDSPIEVKRICAKIFFQFSLWDSSDDLEIHIYFNNNFQFSLWDSKLTVKDKSATNIIFQFSLWDSHIRRRVEQIT